MKELQRTFFYLSVVLETVSEMLCLSSEFVMIHRQDRMRSAVFHKVKEDEVLEGHLISVHKVSSDLDCLQKCLSQDKCVSFNFQLQSPDLHHTCELNDVTREYFGTLGPRRGFSYWEAIRDILQDNLNAKNFLTEGNSATKVLSAPATTMTTVMASTTALDMLTLMAITSTPTSDASTRTAMTSTPALDASTSTSMTSLQSSISSMYLMSSSSAQQAVVNCGADWHSYNSGCVRLFESHKTRRDANEHCKTFRTSGDASGNLVKIMSQADNNLLVSLANTQGRYFIGLSDYSVAGTYTWIGGIVPAYTNWASTHPQSSSTDCVVIDIRHQGDPDHGKWLSEHCINQHKFICECPGACTQS